MGGEATGGRGGLNRVYQGETSKVPLVTMRGRGQISKKGKGERGKRDSTD